MKEGARRRRGNKLTVCHEVDQFGPLCLCPGNYLAGSVFCLDFCKPPILLGTNHVGEYRGSVAAKERGPMLTILCKVWSASHMFYSVILSCTSTEDTVGVRLLESRSSGKMTWRGFKRLRASVTEEQGQGGCDTGS